MARWFSENHHLFPGTTDGSDNARIAIANALRSEFGGDEPEVAILRMAAELALVAPTWPPAPGSRISPVNLPPVQGGRALPIETEDGTPITSEAGVQITSEAGVPITSEAGVPITSDRPSANDDAGGLPAGDRVVSAVSAVGRASASATARAEVIRFAFPAAWEVERQEAIRLLGALTQAVQDAQQTLTLVEEMRRYETGRIGIGHNRPPETIDVPPAKEIVAEATVAADALLTELTAEHPHLSSIRLAGRALRRVAGWIEAVGMWVAKKGDAFLDEYLKALAKPAAIGTVAVIATHLQETGALINAVISPIANLFGMLHLPL